jgi:hypothetical protein
MSEQWAESANKSANGETNLQEWRKFYALCRIFHPGDSSNPEGEEALLSRGQLGTTFIKLFGRPRLEILKTEQGARLDGLDLRNKCVVSPENGKLELNNCFLINTVVRPGPSTSVTIVSPKKISNLTLVSDVGVRFNVPERSSNIKITGRIEANDLIPLVQAQPGRLDLRGVRLLGQGGNYSVLLNQYGDYLKRHCLMTENQAQMLGILSDDKSSTVPRRLGNLEVVRGSQNPNKNGIVFVTDEHQEEDFINDDKIPTPALFEVLSSFLSNDEENLVRFRLHRGSIPRHDHLLVVEKFNEDTLVVYYHDLELYDGEETRKVMMLKRDDAISVLCERSCGPRYDAKLNVLLNFLNILQDPAFSAATDVSWAKKNDESPRVQWTEPERLTDFVFIKTEGQVRAERRTP